MILLHQINDSGALLVKLAEFFVLVALHLLLFFAGLFFLFEELIGVFALLVLVVV